jgi:hypothetical protein
MSPPVPPISIISDFIANVREITGIKSFVVIGNFSEPSQLNPYSGHTVLAASTQTGKLGKSVVEAGNPFGGSKTVSSSGIQDGTSGNVSNGFSILQADDLGAAARLVKVPGIHQRIRRRLRVWIMPD